MKRVIVIGAGVTGLSCAYRLLEKGYKDVTLLEASGEVGGLSRSVKKDDFIFDLGPHQIHTENRQVIDFLKKIVGEDLLAKKKKSSHWFLGKYLNYPLGLGEIIWGLPLHISIPCFLDFIKQSIINFFRKKDKASFESWVISHFGKKMYDFYFRPYTEKVWGKPPSQLSYVCAEERIAVQNLFDVLLSALFRNITKFRKSYKLPHSPYQKIFYYPKFGIGELAGSMASFIYSKGGEIRFNCSVCKIEKKDERYIVSAENGDTLESHYVVSTIPLNNLKNMLLAKEDNKPGDELEFRAITFVLLAVKKSKITDNNWIYFPDKDCIFQRASEFRNFSDNMAPSGTSAICLEIPCDFEDAIWREEDKILYEQTIFAAEKENYLKRTQVEKYWVVRERYSYPTFDLDYQKKLANIKNYLNKFSNLYSIGRQGAFRYINIDEVMLAGFNVADKITEEQY